MNEVIFPPRRRGKRRGLVRKLLWGITSPGGLCGLWPGALDERWLLRVRGEVTLDGLAPEFEGATVAQISDLHCSPLMREGQLRRLVQLVNEMDVDFVAITGDFITASARHYARRAAAALGDLSPRVATVACLGNHDYGIWTPHVHKETRGLGDYVADQLADAGIHVLRNRAKAFFRQEAVLHFAGVEDLWSDSYNPVEAMEDVPKGQPAVALVHNPDAACDLAAMGARYVLAGHTHGIQPRPTRLNNLLFPAKRRELVAGEYSLGQGAMVYVNRGIGNTYPRLKAQRPEIALLRLRGPVRTAAEAVPAREGADGRILVGVG